MFNNNPKVSIIIPVYNGSNYLREAIDSALAQTYSSCEIIVVNDGSNDNGKTEAIALSYGSKIRYFAKQNGGVASALNFGIRSMAGEYFSWLSHDDTYKPQKVQSEMDSLRRQPSDAVVYSDYILKYEETGLEKREKLRPASRDGIRYQLITDTPIHGCTLLFHKKCFEVVGVFDETLQTTQDYHLWFRMTGYFPFVHVAEPLICSRIHSMQGSKTKPSMKTEAYDFRLWAIQGIANETGDKAACLNLARIALRLKALNLAKEADFARSCCRKKLAAAPPGHRVMVFFLLLWFRFVKVKLKIDGVFVRFGNALRHVKNGLRALR
jgi:hypothetical protein